MRIISFIIAAAITIGLVAVLSIKIGTNPPIGKLLSPSHGFWKNAEPTDQSFSLDVISKDLIDSVSVAFDERLVPHVFATNGHDAYFVQGYLHAKFRLWQMDFQAYAAAGRLCEILGEKIGENSVLEGHDRKFRRLGMVYAAENSLAAAEKNAATKEVLEAYTAGVNAYIHNLEPEDYPVEYKLLSYAPEAWTPLKTILIFKYMSYDLTTDFDDFIYTNVRKQLGLAEFNALYKLEGDSVSPIVPKSSPLPVTGFVPTKPANADSLMFADSGLTAMNPVLRDPDIGSNNWAISGSKTASGRPILCNDPHLGLNLPSLWYEIQINTPEYNVYGVSLPGAPTVIIGFNDSIAWGMTNASRDVMDFYEVKFRDSSMGEYWYNNEWTKTEWRTETIHMRAHPDFTDKVPMTVWGPVMYDATYDNPSHNGKAYAVRWTAHDPSVDVSVSMKINRAKGYNDFLDALKSYGSPSQNFIYASKKNTIALWQAGELPAKWKTQGDYVMPGWDTTFAWKSNIAFDDLIHEVNPERGYISSANQLPADTASYPYYLGGSYDVFRSLIINRMLGRLDSTTTAEDMQRMQTSTYDIFAEMALPVLIKNVNENDLTANAKKLYSITKSWNYDAGPNENAKTVFDNWWQHFRDTVWQDDIKAKGKYSVPLPADQTLLEGILRDSFYVYIDNKETPLVESMQDMVTAALNTAALTLSGAPAKWSDFQDTRLTHLLRIPAFNCMNLNVGGGRKIINCIKQDHGPSWRMVVEMTDETNAYGVYPGGQSGNPGSKYYLQFVDAWAAGEYYQLWVMKPEELKQDMAEWVMHFKKA